MICEEATRADDLTVAKMEVVLASRCKLYFWLVVFFQELICQEVLTMPVAFALSFSIVELP
jgi:hypothetical protein